MPREWRVESEERAGDRLERGECRELRACSSVWCHLLAELDQALSQIKIIRYEAAGVGGGAEWCRLVRLI